ncbi:MAG: type II toxin-antitoxin system RelE/ParE family toxin [bacterium]|nr:MAG: type II toxin-antitoxin system RelE/ParE family toxin [bacterium]
MKYRVFILKDAEQDILELYKYVALNDALSKADRLIEKLEEKCKSLSEYANRGHIPPELDRVSVYNYVEIHYKPYRILYQIIDKDVFIHCILDGRRDLTELLHERLLR